MNKNAKKRENICTIQKKAVILREFLEERLYITLKKDKHN